MCLVQSRRQGPCMSDWIDFMPVDHTSMRLWRTRVLRGVYITNKVVTSSLTTCSLKLAYSRPIDSISKLVLILLVKVVVWSIKYEIFFSVKLCSDYCKADTDTSQTVSNHVSTDVNLKDWLLRIDFPKRMFGALDSKLSPVLPPIGNMDTKESTHFKNCVRGRCILDVFYDGRN